jgi:hypothetical protein
MSHTGAKAVQADTEVEVMPLPPKLVLDDDEKLRDNDDQIIELEFYGERHPEDIFVSSSSVASFLGIQNNHHGSLLEGEHYVYAQAPGQLPRLLYTYAGFLNKVISSRSPKSTFFTLWITRVVFAAHLGTLKQKTELAHEMGCSLQASTDFMRHTPKIECIYVLFIGKLDAAMRAKFNIPASFPDGATVVKFGRTVDGRERIIENSRKYGRQIRMLRFAYVSSEHQKDAEKMLKDFFLTTETWIGCVEGHSELATMDVDNKKTMRLLDVRIKEISDKYAGVAKDYIKDLELKDSTNALAVLRVECERDMAQEKLAGKDRELAGERDMAQEKLAGKDRELAGKDRELAHALKACDAEKELLAFKLQLLEASASVV